MCDAWSLCLATEQRLFRGGELFQFLLADHGEHFFGARLVLRPIAERVTGVDLMTAYGFTCAVLLISMSMLATPLLVRLGDRLDAGAASKPTSSARTAMR